MQLSMANLVSKWWEQRSIFKMMEPTKYLFIYGTLLPSFQNEMSEWLVKNSRAICRGTIPGRLYIISEYPAAVYDVNSSSLIQGLIVELLSPETGFPLLDTYEGISQIRDAGDEYFREVRSVTGEDAIFRSCWMYLCNRNQDGLLCIPSGDYEVFFHGQKKQKDS